MIEISESDYKVLFIFAVIGYISQICVLVPLIIMFDNDMYGISGNPKKEDVDRFIHSIMILVIITPFIWPILLIAAIMKYACQ